MTLIDVAVVHVYTQETELYHCMNGALGGWGKPDPDGLQGLTHYTGIIKLLFNALEKLPPMSGEEVFRGVRNVKLNVLLKGKGVGDIVIWGAFTSTSVDAGTLHDPTFFGFEPGLGERVIFHIRNETGVRIQELSEKGCLFGYTDEDEEEVLLKPGSRFVIDSITSLSEEITQVQMHEVVDGDGDDSGQNAIQIPAFVTAGFTEYTAAPNSEGSVELAPMSAAHVGYGSSGMQVYDNDDNGDEGGSGGGGEGGSIYEGVDQMETKLL